MSDTKMIAKFRVDHIKRTEYGEELVMFAVTDAPFDPEGLSDDNTFSKYTPQGELKMTVNNEALHGKLNPGEKYYLTFTKADK